MADRYTRSTDGNNADDGSTWALAKATLAGVAAIDTAGDRLFVSQVHSESTAGAVTIALAGTLASPTQLLCTNDAAEPPTALATGAIVTTTGANAISLTGHVYAYGITFNCGTGATAASISLSTDGDKQTYDTCNFNLVNTGTTGRINLGNSNNSCGQDFNNCTFKFADASQRIQMGGSITITGGGIAAGGTSPTNLFGFFSGRASSATINGFDASAASAGINLILASGNVGAGRMIFRNCKLPASWSGALFSAAPTAPGVRGEMYNCDAGDTNYKLWVEDYCGSIKDETTLVKTGGASDGDTPLSWKMASSANAEYPLHVLRSPEIYSERITAVGSPKTITVDILRDSATNLKDDEIWLEVQYLGTSGFPLALFADDAKADVLAAAADQAASSATWTTTGMSNPNEQKLEVTFTPQEKGVAIITVCMAKASTTVYVDPVAQVT